MTPADPEIPDPASAVIALSQAPPPPMSFSPAPLAPVAEPLLVNSLEALCAPALRERLTHALSFTKSKAAFDSIVLRPPKYLKVRPRLLPHQVDFLLRNGVLTDGTPLLFSGAFCVPKSDPNQSRFILSCATINRHSVDPPPIDLPNPIPLARKVLSFDAAALLDMKSWFFQLPLSSEVAPNFSVSYKRRSLVCTRLPQGWRWSPYIAQTAAMALLPDDPHLNSSVVWLDNFILGARGPQSLFLARSRANNFNINCGKVGATIGESHPPSTRFVALGREWDLHRKSTRLSPEWALRLPAKLLPLLTADSLTVRDVWRVTGCLAWGLRALLLPLLPLYGLLTFVAHLAKADDFHYERSCEWWPSAREAAHSALATIRSNPWMVFRIPPPSAIYLFTDASCTGWGGVYFGRGIPTRVVSGVWDSEVTPSDMVPAELDAVVFSLRSLTADVPFAATVFLSLDSQAGYYALRRGFSINHRVASRLRAVAALLKNHFLLLRFVPTDENPADAPSRGLPVEGALDAPPVTEFRFSALCCASPASPPDDS